MNKNPKVSIVIPVYNASSTIEKTLNSVLNQEYKSIEIIVIDDKSSDDSVKRIKRIINDNKNARIVQNKKNLGPAATRNRGIKESKGEIIFFTDSDCYVPKNWIKKMIDEYENDNIAGVGGYLEPGSKTIVADLERFQNKYLLNIRNKKCIGKEECPTGYTNSMTYKKSVLLETGGFDENYKYPSGEDFDLKKRVCKKGYGLVYIPEPIYHLEEYNLDYLLKRIIARALNKRSPKSFVLRLLLVITFTPVIIVNILIKIIKYKKKNLIL